MQLKKWRLYVTRWWGDDVHCTPGRNGTEFFACRGRPVPRKKDVLHARATPYVHRADLPETIWFVVAGFGAPRVPRSFLFVGFFCPHPQWRVFALGAAGVLHALMFVLVLVCRHVFHHLHRKMHSAVGSPVPGGRCGSCGLLLFLLLLHGLHGLIVASCWSNYLPNGWSVLTERLQGMLPRF